MNGTGAFELMVEKLLPATLSRMKAEGDGSKLHVGQFSNRWLEFLNVAGYAVATIA